MKSNEPTKTKKAMKKTFRFLSMAALALVGAVMTGCSNEDNIDNPQQSENKSNLVTLSMTVGLDGGAETRALDETGHKTFANGDEIAVVYKKNGGATAVAVSDALQDNGDITNSGKSATFTVTLDDPDRTQNVTYIYPAAMAKADGSVNYDALATQDGTLSSLSSDLDLATYTGAWNAGALPTGNLANQLAILAITLKDNAATPAEITSSITGMTVSDGTNSYAVTRSAVAGPIYVAIRPTSDATINISATDGSKNYVKTLATTKTYAASNGYPVSWRMEEWNGDLSALAVNVTVTDGTTLTGTLANNVKISIAAGATVTLDGVTINGTNNNDYEWAGITCLDNATIILKDGTTNTVKGFYEDYPGIHVPSGSTLTIQGTGSLDASSNGAGAGIGGGWSISCGNIVIQGGTITAAGGQYAAGIGGGFSSECGDITISGGTVEATGGSAAAGIGSGFWGECGDITITGAMTSVTATRSANAPYSIGAGKGGSCGTVTIGGVPGAITNSLYTYPALPAASKALSAVTSSEVGWRIGSDGNAYEATGYLPTGVTAVAIIAYVGTDGSVDASSSTYKGLAIAMSDANSGSQCQWADRDNGLSNCLSSSQTDNITTALGYKNGITCTSTLTGAGHSSHGHDAADAAASNNGTAAPTGTSGWFLPSLGQWNLIVQGLATKKAGTAVTTDLAYKTNNDAYKAGNLNSVITDAGGMWLEDNPYWSSTEENDNDAWCVEFYYGYATDNSKSSKRYVRSVLAF